MKLCCTLVYRLKQKTLLPEYISINGAYRLQFLRSYKRSSKASTQNKIMGLLASVHDFAFEKPQTALHRTASKAKRAPQAGVPGIRPGWRDGSIGESLGEDDGSDDGEIHC